LTYQYLICIMWCVFLLGLRLVWFFWSLGHVILVLLRNLLGPWAEQNLQILLHVLLLLYFGG
jgi:hypothetical protein